MLNEEATPLSDENSGSKPIVPFEVFIPELAEKLRAIIGGQEYNEDQLERDLKLVQESRPSCEHHAKILSHHHFKSILEEVSVIIRGGSASVTCQYLLNVLVQCHKKSGDRKDKPFKGPKSRQSISPEELSARTCERNEKERQRLEDLSNYLPHDARAKIEAELKSIQDMTCISPPDLIIATKNIDVWLSELIHYCAKKEGVPRCLCCYEKFKANAINSHVITRWYLHDIIEPSMMCPGWRHSHSMGDMALVGVNKMTLPMQCGECEIRQCQYMEQPLKSYTNILESIKALRWNNCLRGDTPGHKSTNHDFINARDQLPHHILYKFIICNVMRQIGAALHIPDYSEAAWSIFYELRAEVHKLADINSVIIPPMPFPQRELFVYVVPQGGEIFNIAINILKHNFLVAPQNSLHFWMDNLGGENYFCMSMMPFVCVVGMRSIPALAPFRICNRADCVVMSLQRFPAEGECFAATILLNNWCSSYKDYRFNVFHMIHKKGEVQPDTVDGRNIAKVFKYVTGAVERVVEDFRDNPRPHYLLFVFIMLTDFVSISSDDVYRQCLQAYIPIGNVCNAEAALSFEEVFMFAKFVLSRISELVPVELFDNVGEMNKSLNFLRRCLTSRTLYAELFVRLLHKFKSFQSYMLRLFLHFMWNQLRLAGQTTIGDAPISTYASMSVNIA